MKSGGLDRVVRIWNGSNGEWMDELQMHHGLIWCLAVTQTHHGSISIFTGHGDGTICKVSLKNWRKIINFFKGLFSQ